MRRDKIEAKGTAPPEKKNKEKKLNTMDVILIIVGVSLLAFTITMIWIFLRYGTVPDTLITCVFAALGGECGVMGMIKSTKEKYRDREWEKEDREPVEKPAPEQGKPDDGEPGGVG